MADSLDVLEQPSWFTPHRLLALFCFINMLNYLDRGTIASNGVNGSRGDSTCNPEETCHRGTGIQGNFGLSNFEDGVLSSAFMVGLLIASPIFAHLSKRCNPFRLIGVGLSVWTLATACCGFSFDFWSIAISRMLVGVGEASFISLAAPFILDSSPPEKKTAWLSVFYMCMPVGMALGYVYGGVVGGSLSWRIAFWGEAVLMLPFAILGFVSRPVIIRDGNNGRDNNVHILDGNGMRERTFSESLEEFWQQGKTFLVDMKVLFRNKIFTINVLGYIAFNFVLGAYSYWGPKAGNAIYNLENADLVFGGVTIVCGILGTIAGGLVLDYMGSSIVNGFKLLGFVTFVGAIACFLAFLSRALALFIPLFALGELFIFATQGPVNYLTMECVTPDLRPLSMAVSTVCIHIFGDVPSSPLVGVLQDVLNNWRVTTLILTSIFFVASALWSAGILVARRNIPEYTEGTVDDKSLMQNIHQTPLLEDG